MQADDEVSDAGKELRIDDDSGSVGVAVLGFGASSLGGVEGEVRTGLLSLVLTYFT